MGGILGAFLIFVQPAWANRLPSLIELKYCEDRLTVHAPDLDLLVEKFRILNIYSRYGVESLGPHKGYLLRNLNAKASAPTHILEVPELTRPWHTSVWSANGVDYKLLSVGFRNLETHSTAVNQAIIRAADGFPGDNLQILYSPETEKALDNLYSMRWRLHDAVLNKYIEVKKYLSNSDLAMLSWANGWSDNSDVFAVLGMSPKSPEEMSWQDFYDHIAVTMQVTYFGRRDFFKPNAFTALESTGIPNLTKDDKLPFQFRLDPDAASEFVAKVYARFQPEKTCELMRFARFDRGLPLRIYDRFLLEVFRAVERRGMKYILASADDITARLFARYGLRKFATLPVRQHSSPEYLCYIEVGSPAYAAMVKKLEKSVEGGAGNAEAR